MDYKTVIECFIELRQNAYYKEDAVDLLTNEVMSTQDFTVSQKSEFLEILEVLREKKCFGDSEVINKILQKLLLQDGFQKELVNLTKDILLGK